VKDISRLGVKKAHFKGPHTLQLQESQRQLRSIFSPPAKVIRSDYL
jgi:hypothetical protein